MARAKMSDVPPGVAGTMMRTGLLGYGPEVCCATAIWGKAAPARVAARADRTWRRDSRHETGRERQSG